MKRRRKQFIALFSILVIIAAVYGGVRIYKAQKAAALAETQNVNIASMEVLSKISFYNGEENLSFVYDADAKVWRDTDIADFPLASTTFDQIGGVLKKLSAIREVPISEDLAAYGLSEPARNLTATDTSGNTLELLLGAQSGDNYYAMKPGGDTVYTIAGDLYKYLSYELYDLIDIDNFPFATERTMTAITLATPDSSLRLEKVAVPKTEEELKSEAYVSATDNYYWYIVRKDGSRIAVDDLILTLPEDKSYYESDDFVEDVINFVSGGQFQACIDYKASEETLAKYGITDSPTLKITVEYTGKDDAGNAAAKSFTVYVGGYVQKDTEEDSYYFAKLDSSTQLSILQATDIEPCVTALTMFLGAAQ